MRHKGWLWMVRRLHCEARCEAWNPPHSLWSPMWGLKPASFTRDRFDEDTWDDFSMCSSDVHTGFFVHRYLLCQQLAWRAVGSRGGGCGYWQLVAIVSLRQLCLTENTVISFAPGRGSGGEGNVSVKTNRWLSGIKMSLVTSVDVSLLGFVGCF